MLHGYGDHADNFINIAKELHQPNWQVNYIAINAPFKIPNYSEGRQWFNLYPNNIYISDAGPKEIEIIRLEILSAANKIQLTIIVRLNNPYFSKAVCKSTKTKI